MKKKKEDLRAISDKGNGVDFMIPKEPTNGYLPKAIYEHIENCNDNEFKRFSSDNTSFEIKG